MTLAEEIAAAAAEAQAAGPRLVQLRPPAPRGAQFPTFLLVKPELTDAAGGVRVAEVLALVLHALARRGARVGGVAVFNGAWSAQTDFVRSAWRVLARVSREGTSFLDARLRGELAAGTPGRVLGAHQFLAAHPELGVAALELLARSAPVGKAAPGVYLTDARYEGEEYVVLNSFHPRQQAWFTAPENALVAMEVYAPENLFTERDTLVGGITPAECPPESLRRQIHDRRAELGIARFDTARNGVHLSPNVLEAALALEHVFGRDGGPGYDPFGAGPGGASPGRAERVMDRLLERGVAEFGAMEGMSPSDAERWLRARGVDLA